MDQNKTIQPEQEFDLKKKEHAPDKKNYKTTEVDLPEANTKDGDSKPTNKISQNVHTKPADEQQFENTD